MDGFIFKNKFEITENLLKQWSKKPIGNSAKLFKVFSNIFFFVLLFCVVILVFVSIVNAADRTINIIMAAFFFVMAVFYRFLLPKIRIRQRYNYFMKQQLSEAWIRTVKFTENIIVEDGNMQAKYEYSQIKDITQDEKYFYLWLDANLILYIKKGAFSEGHENEFFEFFKSKMENDSEEFTVSRKKSFKKKFAFRILIFVILFAGVITVSIVATRASHKFDTVDEAMQSYCQDTKRTEITRVEFDGEIIAAFATDEKDKIYGMTVEKIGKKYDLKSHHSYSVSEIEDYIYTGGKLFESAPEVLKIGKNGSIVRYGCVKKGWPFTGYDPIEKNDLIFETFKSNDIDYILYYYVSK